MNFSQSNPKCCLLRTYKLCCIARKNFPEGRILFKKCSGSNSPFLVIKHLNQSHSKLGHTSKELDLVPACCVETETFHNGLNKILKGHFRICVIAFPRYIALVWVKKYYHKLFVKAKKVLKNKSTKEEPSLKVKSIQIIMATNKKLTWQKKMTFKLGSSLTSELVKPIVEFWGKLCWVVQI